jgi:HlyD family secretion protein
MKNLSVLFVITLLVSCGAEIESTQPIEQSVSESIYASGYIKSKNQYTVFPKVNGIVEHVYVASGDDVITGSPLISIYNETQKLNNETAKLTANFYNFNSNVEQLNELKNKIDIARIKVRADSVQYQRQLDLAKSGAGVPVDLDNAELAYKNAQSNYVSAQTQYKEYKRQLSYNSAQANKNLKIAGATERDFSVFSEIEGKVYSVDIDKGEMVTTQTPIAVIGDKEQFILEMQIDEKDILKAKLGQNIIVTLDSYGNQTFNAVITKIHPLMDIKSRSFLIEAEFEEQPDILYPNLNFQANIIVASKAKALLIPRSYLVNDSIVILKNGDSVNVKTGLRDFQKIEILEGITTDSEIVKP